MGKIVEIKATREAASVTPSLDELACEGARRMLMAVFEAEVMQSPRTGPVIPCQFCWRPHACGRTWYPVMIGLDSVGWGCARVGVAKRRQAYLTPSQLKGHSAR